MDEQNHSSSSMAAAIDSPSGESSGENAKQDINAALSNIDNKKGKLTDLYYFYVCLNRMNLLFSQLKASAQRAVNDRRAPTGQKTTRKM